MKRLSAYAAITAAAFVFVATSIEDASAKGRSGGSRPSYSGSKHSSSHGGNYAGGHGSPHKGGDYKNSRSGDRYGKHKN
jgi:hypothetical protein